MWCCSACEQQQFSPRPECLLLTVVSSHNKIPTFTSSFLTGECGFFALKMVFPGKIRLFLQLLNRKSSLQLWFLPQTELKGGSFFIKVNKNLCSHFEFKLSKIELKKIIIQMSALRLLATLSVSSSCCGGQSNELRQAEAKTSISLPEMTNLRQKLCVGEPQEGQLKYLWPTTATLAEGNRRNCSCSLRLAEQVSTFASARDFLCGLWSLCQFAWVFCSGFLPQAKTLGEDSKLCVGLIWFAPCLHLLRRLAGAAVFCCCCLAAQRRSAFPTWTSILRSRSEQQNSNRRQSHPAAHPPTWKPVDGSGELLQ